MPWNRGFLSRMHPTKGSRKLRIIRCVERRGRLQPVQGRLKAAPTIVNTNWREAMVRSAFGAGALRAPGPIVARAKAPALRFGWGVARGLQPSRGRIPFRSGSSAGALALAGANAGGTLRATRHSRASPHPTTNEPSLFVAHARFIRSRLLARRITKWPSSRCLAY